MASVLLDTTVLIDVLRNRPATQRVRALRASGDVPCTSAVNVEEVVRGLRSSEEEATREFLAGLLLAPLGLEEAWQAGEWRRSFAARGVTLGQADCLVAAAAFGFRARLATGNPGDFPMRELTVEHWPVGE